MNRSRSIASASRSIRISGRRTSGFGRPDVSGQKLKRGGRTANHGRQARNEANADRAIRPGGIQPIAKAGNAVWAADREGNTRSRKEKRRGAAMAAGGTFQAKGTSWRKRRSRCPPRSSSIDQKFLHLVEGSTLAGLKTTRSACIIQPGGVSDRKERLQLSQDSQRRIFARAQRRQRTPRIGSRPRTGVTIALAA